MTEVEKLHGLHNTGMTMHERFTLLARQVMGRRPLQARGLRARARSQGKTNPALIAAIINQLNQAQKPVPEIPFRGRGRGAGGLRRYGSEGSLRNLPVSQRMRSKSIGYNDQDNNSQKWRRSNGNLSYAGSINGSKMYSSRIGGYWVQGDVTQRLGPVRGRGQGFRGRSRQGRVNRVTQQMGAVRPMRGSGRRGVRRNVAAPGARGQARGRGGMRGRGRGRGGIFRKQPTKPVPTKEELDAQLDQYMAGTKAALDKELDEYMRNAMDFD